MQAVEENFINLLDERRRDWDIMWVSRSMKPLAPHNLPPELIYTRKQAIKAVLSDSKVLGVVLTIAKNKGVPVSTILEEAQNMLQEMASKSHLPTVRWLGKLILIIICLIYVIKNIFITN
jgi:hypothetical protein